jgi:hypothetical protein
MLAAASAAHVATSIYTDEASFLAAAGGGLSTYGFEDFTTDTSFVGAPLDVGAFTVTYSGAISAGFNLIDALPAVSLNNSFASSALVGGVSLDQTIDLVFDTAITAFGATFNALNDDAERSFFTVNGENFTTGVQTGLVEEFVGFVSDTPFTTVTITGLAPSEGFGMDDVQYGGADMPVIPLPASALLLLAGVGALGAARARKA